MIGYKLQDGVYHIASILPKYREIDDYDHNTGISGTVKAIIHDWITTVGQRKVFLPDDWGKTSRRCFYQEHSWDSDFPGRGVFQWHIDNYDGGHKMHGSKTRMNANYIVICALSKYENEGTEFESYSGKTWEIYLMRWDVKHRSPVSKDGRVFLRYYINLNEGEV